MFAKFDRLKKKIALFVNGSSYSHNRQNSTREDCYDQLRKCKTCMYSKRTIGDHALIITTADSMLFAQCTRGLDTSPKDVTNFCQVELFYHCTNNKHWMPKDKKERMLYILANGTSDD